MATLQKFKLLATQCAVVSSVSSPTRSPVIHLRRRRRKTLRMLLSRRPHQSPQSPINSPSSSSSSSTTSLKLKDFLLSSSSPPSESSERVTERVVPRVGGGEERVSLFSRTFNLRQRLFRKPFRPILLTIPE